MKNSNGKNKRRKRKKKLLLLSLVIILVGIVVFLYSYLSSFNSKTNLSTRSGAIEGKEVEKGEPVNILVMGVDIGNPENLNEPKRTDTLILINYNPSNDSVNVISIPRDTRVLINRRHQKINSAHAIGGVKLIVNKVEELFNININYYAKLDYSGFRKIIDSIGGVKIKIPENMYYDDDSQNLHINFKKDEVVHLEGKKAEEFFRWRKNNDGTGLAEGDLGRINNQHMFINKVLEKFKNPSIIPRIPVVMTILPKYVDTNMKPEDIIKYGYNILKIDKDDIKISTLKGESKYIQGISYFIYDKNANAELFREIQSLGNSNTSIDKRNVKINILNGTNINGLAANLAERIKRKGYYNIKTGNSKKTDKSKIEVSRMSKKKIKIIKKDFQIDNIQIKDSIDNGEYIKVILGEDFRSDQ